MKKQNRKPAATTFAEPEDDGAMIDLAVVAAEILDGWEIDPSTEGYREIRAFINAFKCY